MVPEDFSWMLSALRKKLFIIVAVFGAGALFSFPFMGKVIKKIEHDMFWSLNIPIKSEAASQLVDISHNLTTIATHLAANNSDISYNLTKFSGELLNISGNLNLYKPSIIYLTPLEVLMLEFKMSLIVGVLFAFPLITYYAYMGFRGRLTKMIKVNKTFLFSTVLAAIVLFLLGASYSYYFMLPFFLNYIYHDAMSLGVNANFSIYEFIYFIVLITVTLGLAFELPLFMTMLVRFGVTTRQTLAHYRKHAYIILLIIAALITPDPTMFSQVMVMLPFAVLYEVSLLVMRLTGK
jgi:sec-independent protein translocase protein TatC